MKRLLTILVLTTFALRAETLDELLREAENNNPAIATARHQWEAAREQIVVAGALPDPRISYGYYLENVQTKTGPQQQKAGVSQRFPLFGKRGLRADAAAHSAEGIYARYRAVRANTLFQLQQNGFELYYLERALETDRARKKLFQTLEKTAEVRIESGGDARDLLDIRITLTQIEDHLRTLEAKIEPLQAKLNTLLNRDDKTPLTFLETLPPSDPRAEHDARTSFHENNPMIEEQRALLAREQARESLAQRNWMPDITLGADWIQTGDGGDDPLMANLSINLPLWHSKNRAERLRAGFERAAQASHLQEQINRVHVLLTKTFSARNDTARRETLYTAELIPSAEQHFELTRTAYETGAADLRELTASEERLLNLRLTLERSRTDRAIADAEIKKILGGPSK